MPDSIPLPGMHAAVVSLQKRHMEALTGEGRGLSISAMALHLEAESGMRDLYNALEALCGTASLNGGDALHAWLNHPEFPERTPGTMAKAALAKARGEKPSEPTSHRPE